MSLADKFKSKVFSSNGDGRRFDEIVTQGTTNVLKELGGYGVKESKVMVDNIIAFTNCSGGTGASTIASNIAYVLGSSLFNMNVLVIDLNIVCPIQNVYFAKDDEKQENDIVDYLTGQCKIGDATVTHSNVSIMYAINRSVADSINCEEDIALQNFEDLLHKVRDLYDVVIIDCPMQITNGLCNIAMYAADKIYTVWDEGLSSVINTDRVMRQLGFTGIDSFAKMFVIMNKKTSVKYSKFPFEKLKLPLLETLPFSTDVIYSSLDASVYCASGKARNKNGGEFENHIMSLARKIVLLGGKTDLADIDENGFKIEKGNSSEHESKDDKSKEENTNTAGEHEEVEETDNATDEITEDEQQETEEGFFDETEDESETEWTVHKEVNL